MSTSYNSFFFDDHRDALSEPGINNCRSIYDTKKTGLHTGVCIVGTEPGCGKTVLMSGLAGVLGDYSGKVRAVKPVTYSRQQKSSPEYSFISNITRTPVDYPSIHLSFPPTLSQSEWDQIILTATANDAVTFIELPTTVATPLSFEKDGYNKLTHEWYTTTDLIRSLGYPVILVSKHAPDALEKLSMSLNYLQSGGIQVLSLATVETNPLEAQSMDRYISKDDFELFMITGTGVPYLGCLRYSPSISVQDVSQGNLKRMVEECLDILVLRRSLKLPVVRQF
jgi:dethiobiotin synthetase